MNKDKIKLWNKIRSDRGLKGEESQLAQDVFSECYDTLTAKHEEEAGKLKEDRALLVEVANIILDMAASPNAMSPAKSKLKEALDQVNNTDIERGE